MNLEIFLAMLAAVATFTSLVTEGIKNLLKERQVEYYANELAGYVAIALSVGTCVCYMILTETAFSGKMAVYIIVLTLMSWLSAMVGYDKVIQTIMQLKGGNANDQ